jgi:hypothetical protein
MGKVIKICFAAAVAVLAIGASPTSPPAGDVATLRFEKGYDKGLKAGAASVQSYSVLKDGSCVKSKKLARLTWTTGPAKEVQVPAGALIRFEAQTTRHTYATLGYCVGMFSFTPQPGHSYSIKHQAIVNVNCRTQVIDLATGAAPADLDHFDRAECTRRL